MRFTVYALVVVATYTFLEWRGVNLLPNTTRFSAPASVRNSPGGYRSYQVYHGFHGGK
jgi:hypothetical protein